MAGKGGLPQQPSGCFLLTCKPEAARKGLQRHPPSAPQVPKKSRNALICWQEEAWLRLAIRLILSIHRRARLRLAWSTRSSCCCSCCWVQFSAAQLCQRATTVELSSAAWSRDACWSCRVACASGERRQLGNQSLGWGRREEGRGPVTGQVGWSELRRCQGKVREEEIHATLRYHGTPFPQGSCRGQSRLGLQDSHCTPRLTMMERRKRLMPSTPKAAHLVRGLHPGEKHTTQDILRKDGGCPPFMPPFHAHLRCPGAPRPGRFVSWQQAAVFGV